MKITPTQPHFKGHAAGKIKALYMTNPGNQRQIDIYNEIRNIGSQEGFDVFMHTGAELKNEPLQTPDNRFNYWGVWAQDNKIITHEDGKPVLYTSNHQRKEELLEAQLFAKNSGIKGFATEINFDGGDIFLGKKDDGEKYLITSEQTIFLNSIFQHLKEINPNYATRETLISLINNGICFDKNGAEIANLSTCSKNSAEWEKYARDMLCEVFEIKPENLIIVPSPEFHLDLAIRPLDYPYILVNDDAEVDKLIAQLELEFKDDFFKKAILNDIKEKIEIQREKFASSDEICTILEANGFIPIKIAMMFGRSEINFANAIVHQGKNGLIYITNSSTTKSSNLTSAFQKHFEKEIKTKCPQINKTYFVSGKQIGEDLNDMMALLKDYKGGIHCLCCEEMEE